MNNKESALDEYARRSKEIEDAGRLRAQKINDDYEAAMDKINADYEKKSRALNMRYRITMVFIWSITAIALWIIWS